MPSARVTTTHIARHLGVSATTVRHVLNGHAERVGIRQETRQRVLDAVRELGYRPNASARAMSTGRFGSVALIQPYKAVYLPSDLLLSLTHHLEARDMHLSIARLGDEAIGDPDYLPKVVREVTADGLLLNVISGIPAAFREAIRAHRVPTVWINSRQEYDCVHPDDLGGGRAATEFLLSLGHERIAFLKTAPLYEGEPHYSEADRFAGYEAAMRAAGLTPRREMLSPTPENREQILADRRAEDAAALLTAPDRPTAFVAYEIEEALAVCWAAARLGLSVPGDLSVLMFHKGATSVLPFPLTTMQLAMGEVGDQAVDLLVSKIADPERDFPPRAVPVRLFQGNTCAPPRLRPT
jgi:LacI family transcriptional regulator